MTAEQPIGIFEVVQPLVGRLVARIGNEALCLQQAGLPY